MKTKKELEIELSNLRNYNLEMWKIYGSELCAGDMIKQEKKIEDQIKELENAEIQ